MGQWDDRWVAEASSEEVWPPEFYLQNPRKNGGENQF